MRKYLQILTLCLSPLVITAGLSAVPPALRVTAPEELTSFVGEMIGCKSMGD